MITDKTKSSNSKIIIRKSFNVKQNLYRFMNVKRRMDYQIQFKAEKLARGKGYLYRTDGASIPYRRFWHIELYRS